jgi:hypothetical protein
MKKKSRIYIYIGSMKCGAILGQINCTSRVVVDSVDLEPTAASANAQHGGACHHRGGCADVPRRRLLHLPPLLQHVSNCLVSVARPTATNAFASPHEQQQQPARSGPPDPSSMPRPCRIITQVGGRGDAAHGSVLQA